MVVTRDPKRAEKVRVIRAHGSKPKYYHKVVGGNFRLDALQAAIITAKLPHLDSWTAGRQKNAKTYDRLIAESNLPIQRPKVVANHRHIFNQYVIRVADRDKVQAFLREKGVGTEVYYPVPMHLQECFVHFGYKKGDFPASEAAANETLALPVYPEVSEEQVEYVVTSLSQFLSSPRSSEVMMHM